MSEQFSYPPARLSTVVSSDPIHLPLAQALEPTSTATVRSSSAPEAAALPGHGVLSGVAQALLNADISHVRPRAAATPFAPAPGTLQYALLAINNQVFAHAARPAPPPVPLQEAAEAQRQQQQQQHGGRAAGRPATRTAPEAVAQAAPAAKRRKRAASTDEEFVARTVDPQQVAADVAAHVEEFMAAALSLQSSQPEAGSTDEEEQAGAGPAAAAAAAAGSGRKGRLWQPFIPLDSLKGLQTSLAAGKQAGVIAQLDHQQLRQLLLLLLDHVRLGTDQLLQEHDKASDAGSKAVLAALEAACCCMQLLASPGLPNSLYLDELVTAAINTAKYQLQYNVLALHDPQCRRLYRPSSAQSAAAEPATGKKRSRSEAVGGKVSRMMGDVRDKLELLLALLAQVVDRVLLEVERLLPLVHVALTCLRVDSLQLLQAQAITLAVAVFRAFPQQRSSLMDEVLSTVVANIGIAGTKGPPRLCQASDSGARPMHIQMATALIMQLVQACVQLPPVDAEPAAIQRAFSGAYGWPDKFWEGVFARLPAAKAARSDGAADFKAVTEALLADLLTVQMLPEWPAATILLRRFLKMLHSDKGLQHPDAAVRMAAVEFTGQAAARLCGEAVQAEQEVDEVQAVLEAAEAAADPAALPEGALRTQQLLDSLLLDHLAAATAGRGDDDPSSCVAAARRFVCCRMLSDAVLLAVKLADKKGPKKEELSRLLVQHRQLQDSRQPVLGAGVASLQLTRSQHVSLVRRWVVEGPLGAGRANIIKWLVEAGSRSGPDPNPATVRTKVFKCLGCVVEADSRVLALPDVATAVRAALADDSVAVREAALELLAKLIATNPQLAGEYFDVLVAASHDAGVSVRKRAIRSLWDCCTCPGFSRAAEAVVAVLQRAGDSEDSMRGLVTKICGEMWFTESSSFAGLADGGAGAASSSSAASRTAEVRARELGEVALKVVEARGKGIHVPLPPDHALLVILREVLGCGQGSAGASAAVSAAHARELAAVRRGAAEVAEALLSLILQSQQEQAEGSDGSPGAPDSSGQRGQFPHLLALHALCAADAALATPVKDPQRFVRCLAPYVASAAATAGGLPGTLARQLSRTASMGGAGADDASRRSAEECLCLLAVLEALLRHLGAAEQDVLQQLSTDVMAMFQSQRIPQVISAGCRLLCAIAPLHRAVVPQLAQLATRCHNAALNCLSQQPTAASTPNSPAHAAHAPRTLYILGQLCRYGAPLLDEAARENAGMKNSTECLELCVALWQRPELSETPVGQRVRDAALQALGMIVIGNPALMLQQLQLSLLGAADQQQQQQQHLTSGGGEASAANSAGSDPGSPPQQQQARQRQSASGAAAGGACQASVARVYASVLSGPEPVAVKTRVLSNLVELLRSEEAALLARQKGAEAAAASSRLASTLPGEAKGPLSKVNGETDAAISSGSSIIQNVWQDVLRLATGVPGTGGGPPGTPGAAAAAAGSLEAAATMRRKALELMEVVLRGGLVAPWSAVAPLVAQSTDPAPDTRLAALKVLKGAADKYADYVAGQLAPGVVEAYRFQGRLWAAKHPGQPLPKAPAAEVLGGLVAMYAEIVQPATNTSVRQRFLSNLFRPFEAAINLANPAAVAREDVAKLAFVAHVAAALPFRRGDEPLVLVHAINAAVSRRAQEVRDRLRTALLRLGLRATMGLEEDDEEDEEGEGEGAGQEDGVAGGSNAADASGQQQPSDALPGSRQQRRGSSSAGGGGGGGLSVPLGPEVLAPLKASLALSVLLVLKQYLMAGYGLGDERVAAFELKGERFRGEAKALVSRDRRLGEFGLGPINLRCLGDATGELLGQQYKTFRGLLDTDAANYREAAVLAALEEGDDEDAAGEAGGTARHVSGATPAAGGKGGAVPGSGLVVFTIDKKAGRAKPAGKAGGARTTGGKAAGRGRGGGRGRDGGRGAATTGAKAKKGRKRRSRFGSDDDEGDASDDEEWEGDGKRKLW